MCTEQVLKICIFVFAAITLILSYQFFHYLSFEFAGGREADAGVVIIYIISFLITVIMCALAIWAALRSKVKLALLTGITFLVMSMLLLIQIILFAVAASGKGCGPGEVLENIIPCGVDPGGLYAPLVLIMLSSLALGISLLLFWSVIKEESGENGDQSAAAKDKRRNYY
jgi:hypothetical protein